MGPPVSGRHRKASVLRHLQILHCGQGRVGDREASASRSVGTRRSTEKQQKAKHQEITAQELSGVLQLSRTDGHLQKPKGPHQLCLPVPVSVPFSTLTQAHVTQHRTLRTHARRSAEVHSSLPVASSVQPHSGTRTRGRRSHLPLAPVPVSPPPLGNHRPDSSSP